MALMEWIYHYQGHLYVLMSVVLCIALYAYIYHLYSSQKKGRRDYEKYSQIALDDDITSSPVEELAAEKESAK